MPLENPPKRAPRPAPKPYNRSGKPRKSKNAPKTSAKPVNEARQNLTLHDWMTIIAYYDSERRSHPNLSHSDVVKYFSKRPEGALIFTQSSLSRHLSADGRKKDQDRLASAPVTALSSKRARVVTRPDVEQALVLWVKHMESKNEHVSGPMLIAKREIFEQRMGVPPEERMRSHGWISKFLSAYGLKEHRRHGEAASVDREAVRVEIDRVQKIISEYSPRDVLNFDESALFPHAPPDRGISSKQMSGKKANKFRITVGFMCNATGTEKWPIFFIGKSKQPRCFKGKTAERLGFNYRNNQNAWMTGSLFEEWIQQRDLQFRRQNRKVLLLIDNFSGHSVAYKPTNIRVEFFAPNMTPFVQPLDAGVIRCFKAHYRRAFCLRAIERDEAGDDDIYRIDLLTGMLMAKEAWEAVSAETIANCWKHTKILEQPSSTAADLVALDNAPTRDQEAWAILRAFASSDDVALPVVEDQLRRRLGARYAQQDWKPAFDAIFEAEGDILAAVEAVQALEATAMQQPAAQPEGPVLAPMPRPNLHQLDALEQDLIESVKELKSRNRIRGEPLTLDELVDPVEERQKEENEFAFPGGDAEIVQEVERRRAGHDTDAEQEAQAEADADDALPEPPPIVARDGVVLCERLEAACLAHPDAEGVAVLELQRQLRRLRAHFRRLDLQSHKQVTLDTFFTFQTGAAGSAMDCT